MYKLNQTVEVFKDGISQGKCNVSSISKEGFVKVAGRWYDTKGKSVGFSYSHYAIFDITVEDD
jgi:hypothetical protein